MRLLITGQGAFAFVSGALFVGVIACLFAAVRDPQYWGGLAVVVTTIWLATFIAAYLDL